MTILQIYKRGKAFRLMTFVNLKNKIYYTKLLIFATDTRKSIFILENITI